MADTSPEVGQRLGRILMLNGTSRPGKTTLTRALQPALPDPWLKIGIDRLVFALTPATGRFSRSGALSG